MMRIDPKLPSSSMKTYQIVAPLSTHWRQATCAEAECAAYLNGWRTKVDEGSELGQSQAYFIRKLSGRGITEERDQDGTTVFTFLPGQRCFAPDHKVRLEREEIFVVRDGDWRGNPRGTSPRIHSNGRNWVDDFSTHQQRLADAAEEG